MKDIDLNWLKEELEEWQDGYKHPADKKQHDFFATLINAVDRLASTERANSAQSDHINQQQDRIGSLEKKNASLGSALGTAERERDELRERLALVREQRDAELNKNTQLESELARRDAAAREPVAYTSQANIDAVSEKSPKQLEFMSGDKRVYRNPVALYLNAQPAAFPPATDKSQGWTIDPEYLQSISDRSSDCDGVNPSLETVESVLLALGAQPAVLPPEMTLTTAEKFINEHTPPTEEEAALFAYNQCRADAPALGAQPQKVVELPSHILPALVDVLRWIERLPVPTKSAAAKAMRLGKAISDIETACAPHEVNSYE